jgi:hypothetical protein
MVDAFKKAYPGIRMILDQGSNSDIMKSVEENRNEPAVIGCTPDNCLSNKGTVETPLRRKE